MICLEVSLNGNVLCTAGIERVYAGVRATGPQRVATLNVREMHQRLGGPPRAIYWVDGKKLCLGDEVTIRLVDVPVNDPAQTPDAKSESN